MPAVLTYIPGATASNRLLLSLPPDTGVVTEMSSVLLVRGCICKLLAGQHLKLPSGASHMDTSHTYIQQKYIMCQPPEN